MRQIATVRTVSWLAGLSLAALAAMPATGAGPQSEEDLWKGAMARIEEHRKADAVVAVVDALGRPAPNLAVRVEQTRHEFLFGANFFVWGQVGSADKEAAYRGRFADLLNYATLPFYWPSYEWRRSEPAHGHAAEVAQWCKEHGIATKGHPLAWNFADPAWLPDDLEEVRRLQMARIDDCVSHFAGLVDRWDVVNEATHFDRREFLRSSPKISALWQKLGQMEFTRECFVHARKANSKATLVINDYRTDPAFERVIERLVDSSGKPMYDVIGIQSHMHGGTWTNRQIWDVCERFARFKVPLHFTETTILSGQKGWARQRPWPSTAEGEPYQAREVVRFYTMLFSHPAVAAITWWDFSDHHAWQGAPAGFLRADMSPKPAYEELMRLVKGKWWTTAEIKTGADGTARFRGFPGGYRLTVTTATGKRLATEFTLVKQGLNRWTIRLP